MQVEYVAIGKIKSACGIKGKVRIVCLTDFPARFKSGLVVQLSPPLPNTQELVVETAEIRNKEIILKFTGIDHRDQVDSLKGRILQVPVDETVPLANGVYWQFEIIGLKVYTVNHAYLGIVDEILKTGANDVYVVKSPDSGKEILIPAIKEVIKTVDLEKGLLVISPLPGLIEEIKEE